MTEGLIKLAAFGLFALAAWAVLPDVRRSVKGFRQWLKE